MPKSWGSPRRKKNPEAYSTAVAKAACFWYIPLKARPPGHTLRLAGSSTTKSRLRWPISKPEGSSLKTINSIATIGPDKVAWFKDSEGNLLVLVQVQGNRI